MIEFRMLESAYKKLDSKELADLLIQNGFSHFPEVKITKHMRMIILQDGKSDSQIWIKFTQEQNL